MSGCKREIEERASRSPDAKGRATTKSVSEGRRRAHNPRKLAKMTTGCGTRFDLSSLRDFLTHAARGRGIRGVPLVIGGTAGKRVRERDRASPAHEDIGDRTGAGVRGVP